MAITDRIRQLVRSRSGTDAALGRFASRPVVRPRRKEGPSGAWVKANDDATEATVRWLRLGAPALAKGLEEHFVPLTDDATANAPEATGRLRSELRRTIIIRGQELVARFSGAAPYTYKVKYAKIRPLNAYEQRIVAAVETRAKIGSLEAAQRWAGVQFRLSSDPDKAFGAVQRIWRRYKGEVPTFTLPNGQSAAGKNFWKVQARDRLIPTVYKIIDTIEAKLDDGGGR